MQTSLTSQILVNTPQDITASPFLKWAGGKRQLLEQIAAYLPKKMQTGKIKKYAETFIGGGALFFFHSAKIPEHREFLYF